MQLLLIPSILKKNNSRIQLHRCSVGSGGINDSSSEKQVVLPDDHGDADFQVQHLQIL